MNENIFDKRRLKTFSNCKDLVKSMIGTRDGIIFYNEKFRLDLETTCYKASMYNDLQQENQSLKDRIEKGIEYINHFSKKSEVKIHGLPDCKVFIGDIEQLSEILKGDK